MTEKRLSWAQATLKPPAQKYVYSKEYILSFYTENCSISASLDLTLAAVSAQTLPPLANVPLSDLEKKLFSSSNFNSDGNRRNNFKNREEKRYSKQRQGSLPDQDSPVKSSHDHLQSPPSNEDVSEDLWDTPSGIGNFGSDGVFHDKVKSPVEKTASQLDSPAQSAKSNPIAFGSIPSLQAPSTSNRFGVTLKDTHDTTTTPMESVNPSAKKETLPLEPISKSRASPIPTMPIQPPVKPVIPISPPSKSSTPIQPHPHVAAPTNLVNKALMEMSSNVASMPMNAMTGRPVLPPFNFQPHGWLYRDPVGMVQGIFFYTTYSVGPFTSQQMQDWYTEGFFPPELPIKHENETNFQPLVYLVNRFGSKNPFLAELEDAHAIARMMYERRVLSLPLQQDMTANMSGLGDAMINVSHPRDVQWNPSSVGANWEDTSMNFSNPRPNHGLAIQNMHIPSGVVSNPPSQVQKPQHKVVEPSVPQPKAVIEKPTYPVIQPPAARTQAAPEPIKPEPKTLTSPTAPWASSASGQSPTNATKVSLKEIQTLQQKRQSIQEAERQKKILESPTSPSVGWKESPVESARSAKSSGPAWGKPSSPADLSKPLSEIMLEEETRKSTTDASNSSTGGVKRYADLVQAPNGVRMNSKTSFSELVSTSAVKTVPSTKENEWQTVKPASQRPAPSSRPASVHAATAQITASPVSKSTGPSPTSATSPSKQVVSDAFLEWFQSALKVIPSSSGVNVKAFLSILLSISLNDKAFILNVCDDTLGGITSIDARKFAQEFIRRRVSDAQPAGSTKSVAFEDVKKSEDFQVVGKKKKKSTISK